MPVCLPRWVVWALCAVCASVSITCVEIPDNAVFACEEGGCPRPLVCKGGFCVNEDCKPVTCAGLGKNCGTLSDGCGNELDCGGCTAPDSCTANVCACAPTPAAAMCADAGSTCGVIDTIDACGNQRSVSCGGCSGAAICVAGGCCTPQTQAQLCAVRSLSCGAATVTDNCGQARTVECGGCDAGSACIHFDTSASCEPCSSESDFEFCYRTGHECGSTPNGLKDNCGVPRASVGCGQPGPVTCGDGRTCGADGGTRCACAVSLQSCSSSSQCCAGMVCGKAGLCCRSAGQQCSDDGECCTGSCAAGQCGPLSDGGTQ